MNVDIEPRSANCLSYSSCPGGVTNQKLALFGLLLRALETGRPIILPDFLIFDQNTRRHVPVGIDRILNTGPLRTLAACCGIEILDRAPLGIWGDWDYVLHGRHHLARCKLEGTLSPDSFPCAFFRSIVPLIHDAAVLRQVADNTFGARRISVVAQLRIERDWTHYIASNIAPVSRDEDHLPTFGDILAKLKRTLPQAGAGVYVVCDETALPALKDDLRRQAREQLRLELVWKSDFLSESELGSLSFLDLSLLDFEMALLAPFFVGLSRSSFSCAVTFETYARNSAQVTSHYIYNVPGSRLGLRIDNGAFEAPQLAARDYYTEKLLSYHRAQIYQLSGQKQKALEAYIDRAELRGQSEDEVYVSLYRAAQLKAELDFEPDHVIETFLQAADLRPDRVEALHGASRYCRIKKLYPQGYEIGKRSLDRAVPENGLCVEQWIYDYGALDEFSVNAFWVGDYAGCIQACTRILERKTFPPEHRGRILRNAQLALERL